MFFILDRCLFFWKIEKKYRPLLLFAEIEKKYRPLLLFAEIEKKI